MNISQINKTLKIFAQDIKISHSVFSFPFVGSTLIISGAKLNIYTMTLVIFSLTCARSFAMGMNRYFDRNVDAKNPRTSSRALPSKKLSSKATLRWSLTFGLLFIISSSAYNTLTLLCSVPVLCILGFYPLTKKWTWSCHLYLGLCLALSPLAASIAVTGTIPLTSYLIAFAVLLWVSGFDIIYAAQDYDFDKQEQLFSIPTFFGIKKALFISQVCFLLMIVCLVFLGYLAELGIFYSIGITLISLILFYEHYSLSKMTRFNKINPIFFTANAWVSLIFLLFVSLDFYLK